MYKRKETNTPFNSLRPRIRTVDKASSKTQLYHTCCDVSEIKQRGGGRKKAPFVSCLIASAMRSLLQRLQSVCRALKKPLGSKREAEHGASGVGGEEGGAAAPFPPPQPGPARGKSGVVSHLPCSGRGSRLHLPARARGLSARATGAHRPRLPPARHGHRDIRPGPAALGGRRAAPGGGQRSRPGPSPASELAAGAKRWLLGGDTRGCLGERG